MRFGSRLAGRTQQPDRLFQEVVMDLTAITPATTQPATPEIDLNDPAIAAAFEQAAGTVFAMMAMPLLQQVLSSAND